MYGLLGLISSNMERDDWMLFCSFFSFHFEFLGMVSLFYLAGLIFSKISFLSLLSKDHHNLANINYNDDDDDDCETGYPYVVLAGLELTV